MDIRLLIRRSQSRLSSLVIAVLVICVVLSMGCGGEPAKKDATFDDVLDSNEEQLITPDYQVMSPSGKWIDGTPCSLNRHVTWLLQDEVRYHKSPDSEFVPLWNISTSHLPDIVSSEHHTSQMYRPPATVELLAWNSDVVARVKIVDEIPSVMRVSSSLGGFIAINEFQFEVLEYLKGGGASKICVIEEQFYIDKWASQPVMSESDARALSSKHSGCCIRLSYGRGFSYDSEGILFLSILNNEAFTSETTPLQSGGIEEPIFTFTGLDPSPYNSFEEWGGWYARRTQAWLPLSSLYGVGYPDVSNDPTYQFSHNSHYNYESEEWTLSDIESLIKSQEKLLSQWKHRAGYRECVRIKLYSESRISDDGLRKFNPTILRYASSLDAGFAIDSKQDEGYDYGKWRVTGEDAALFNVQIIDPDQDSTTGYDVLLATAQGLEAGEYPFTFHLQWSSLVPCDYVVPDYGHQDYLLIVYPHQDVLFDARFLGVSHDLYTDSHVYLEYFDSEISASTHARFMEQFKDIYVRNLDWRDGRLRLALSNDLQIFDRDLELLDTEGKVLMSLDFASIVKEEERQRGIYVWDVPEQPWDAGDELRVRIK